MGHGVLFTLVLVFGTSRPFENKYVSERKNRKKHNVMYESQGGWGPIHWWRLLKRNRSGYTLGTRGFYLRATRSFRRVGRRPTCLRPKPETALEKSLTPRVLRLVLSHGLYLPHKIERLLNLNFGYRRNSYRMRSITLALRAMSMVGFFLWFVSKLFEVLKYFIHGLACSGF